MFTWKRVAIVLSIAVGIIIISAPVAGQIRPAMVRSVDEPARVPYQVQAAPTCPFLNECYVTGTVVPAGKRLRLTYVQGALISQSTSMFAAVHLNDTRHPIFMFPASLFNGFFWGNIVSFNQPTDLFFEAGQTPVLEIGCSAVSSINVDPRNTLTLVGYLVDVAP